MKPSETAEAIIVAMNSWGEELERVSSRFSHLVCPHEALFVESPWYGVLEIVGEPSFTSTECWDGEHLAWYVTGTLRSAYADLGEDARRPAG